MGNPGLIPREVPWPDRYGRCSTLSGDDGKAACQNQTSFRTCTTLVTRGQKRVDTPPHGGPYIAGQSSTSHHTLRVRTIFLSGIYKPVWATQG